MATYTNVLKCKDGQYWTVITPEHYKFDIIAQCAPVLGNVHFVALQKFSTIIFFVQKTIIMLKYKHCSYFEMVFSKLWCL